MNDRFSIDINDVSNGLYLLNIITQEGMYSKMFSVQH